MGWLNSRPKQHKNDSNPRSRAEMYPEGDPILQPPIPDVVVVSALQACGVSMQGGMGRSPITWAELQAYSGLSGANLIGWEAEQVIIMSRAYCGAVHEATEHRAMRSPWEPELTEDDIYRRGAKASGMADEALNPDNY